MAKSTFKASTYAASATWLEDSKVQYAENPKRGKSFQRYAAYEKAATVGEALKLGSLPADLLFDFEHGLLRVFEPLREKPLDLFAVKSFEELTYTDKVLCRYIYLADPSRNASGTTERIQVLEEAIRKQRANMRRLRKFQIAKALDIQEVDSLADTTGFWESHTMMARRSMANQQAKEILAVVEATNRKVTDFEVLSVLRLWDFRENVTRCNVMKPGQTFVYSDTMGLVADRSGHIIAKEETKRYPQFGQFLCRWLRDSLPPDFGAEFVFTSININKNYAGRLHRDGSNVGPSCLKAFGDFTGGQLNYFAEDDRSIKLEGLEEMKAEHGLKLDVAHGLALFDGKRGHWVDDFEGERYTLVFFTCPRYNRATEETRQTMDAAGFPLPSEASMAKVMNLLRKPRGYGAEGGTGAAAAGASVHNAPFMFWADTPDHLEQEAEAKEFWQRRGLREPIKADAFCNTTRIEWEHTKHRSKGAWSEIGLFLVLPGEPKRTDLILPDHKNLVDAVGFLNAPESRVPRAIVDAACCAVFSNRTKVWYALYQQGHKEHAFQTFGLKRELPQPPRSTGARSPQQWTPPRKRKQPDAESTQRSAKKQRSDKLRLIIKRPGAGKAKPVPARAEAAAKHSKAGTTSKAKMPKLARGKSTLAGKLARSVEVQRKTKVKKGRPVQATPRKAAMEKLSVCAGETSVEFTPNAKTSESHPCSYQRYAGYSKAKTLAEALDLGAAPGDLVYDCQAGHLKILRKHPQDRARQSVDRDGSLSRFDGMAKRWRAALALLEC